MKLKICRMGDSLGVNIPQEILDRMNVGEGNSLYLIQTPDGIKLTPYESELELIMEAAEDIASRYDGAMKKLSK